MSLTIIDGKCYSGESVVFYGFQGAVLKQVPYMQSILEVKEDQPKFPYPLISDWFSILSKMTAFSIFQILMVSVYRCYHLTSRKIWVREHIYVLNEETYISNNKISFFMIKNRYS